MFCNQCGSQLADGSKFCANCGNKIQYVSPTTATTTTTTAVPPTAQNLKTKSYADIDFSQIPMEYQENINHNYTAQQNVNRQPMRDPNVRYVACPNCGGLRLEAMGDNTYGRKVKNKTSININPLHPLTVFNTKEKVVKQGYTIAKWHCLDCGNVFEKNPKSDREEQQENRALIIGSIAFGIFLLVCFIVEYVV